jgi:hypothetical protein
MSEGLRTINPFKGREKEFYNLADKVMSLFLVPLDCRSEISPDLEKIRKADNKQVILGLPSGCAYLQRV